MDKYAICRWVMKYKYTSTADNGVSDHQYGLDCIYLLG